MAVSKTHPVGFLLEAYTAGHRLFGENRVQEFTEKAYVLATAGHPVDGGRHDQASPIQSSQDRQAKEGRPGNRQAESGVRSRNRQAERGEHPERSEGPAFAFSSTPHEPFAVHLIGHLQSNKSAAAAEVFSAIDTLDSLRLAERLHAAAERLNRTLPVIVEIKLSPEKTKEGLAPGSPELKVLLERLPDLARRLPLRGLMTVAPISPDPAVARACFRSLRELRDQLARQHPRLAFEELSMGMSGDYETAIEEGSTAVRIGTAIFGIRPKLENRA